MRRPERRRGTGGGRAGRISVAALAALLLGTAPVLGPGAVAQGVPSEFLPEALTGHIIGEGTDYYGRDDRADQLLYNIERFHLSEQTFWKKYRDGDLREAQGDLIFALRYFPNHPRALYLMEIVSKAMGDPEGAISYYERALRLFPRYPFTRAQYGSYLIRMGARSAGITELRAALAADSTLVQARISLEQALAAPAATAPERSAPPSRPDGGTPRRGTAPR